MAIKVKVCRGLLLLALVGFLAVEGRSQCGGILEPGFAFLTSSRGCAPFTVNIQTIYLASVPGTQYFVQWGDGTPEETYTQVGAGGVTMSHTYPLASVNCGYDVVIDASNACNPRGSVVPINTQVIVWTRDVVSINPGTVRVCAGFAADVLFTDNSTWNCFPRATRENNEARWIQWQYGTGLPANQIPGVEINSVLPGSYPYLNPAPASNPFYPVAAPGMTTLPIHIPATVPADIGKEFQVTLRNWNQCNAYDDNVLDGNGLNPVGGDLVNGDNPPQTTTARVVVVPAPQPDYVTRLGNAGGPVQSVFCIGDAIYFDNNTPPIGGASFQYTWEFFDNPTGAGLPLTTSSSTNPVFAYSTSGQKLIRLSVRDANAIGGCQSTYDAVITISPSLIAQIAVTDILDVPISPEFCQESQAPFTSFTVRFTDASVGSVLPTTEWRWEFYDETNTLILESPPAGAFSAVPLGPFDRVFVNRGVYRVRLIVRDNATSCESADEAQVTIYEKPVPLFSATRSCEGIPIAFTDASTLNPVVGESIVLREWDFDYDGVTFTKDPAFDNQASFSRDMGTAGTYSVALRVTTNGNGCTAMTVVPVTVDPLPFSTFTASTLSGCSLLPVTFTNTSVLGQPDVIAQFVWEEDSGSGFQAVATQIPGDPAFTDTLRRVYENTSTVNRVVSMRLRAVTINGCERTLPAVAITVFPGTASGFVATNYSPFNDNCSPVGVNFAVDAATQALSPSDYRWQVSDISGVVADISTGTTPAFSFSFVNPTTFVRDFSVRLTTTLASGCYGDSTRTIRVSPVPSSAFIIDTVAFDCQRMRVRLTATQKGLEYHWMVVENGVTLVNSVGANDVLEHEVTRVALGISLAISLDTRNPFNCTSPVTTQGVIVPARDAINAAFTVSPPVQSLPSATVFITNTTSPGPWTYQWDFGDGTTSTNPGPALQHTYATYGVYPITLTVINNVCVETVTQTVTVQAIPPVIDFSANPVMGCAPLTVSFTNLSQFAESGTFVWRFGDGQATSNAIDPTYTYFEPGTYSVSLSGTNVTNQVVTETKTAYITVFEKPRADFAVKPVVLYIPGGKLFTKNNSIGAGRFLWDFGDGVTSEDVEPVHVYAQEGLYDISLVAISPDECRDTARVARAVEVEQGGTMLVPNAFSPSTAGPSGGQTGSGGKNDVFLPLMVGVTQFEMVVFNRWGELLFQSTDPTIGWDGYHRGQLCPQDVYVYKITAVYSNGEQVVRTGDINLIR